MTPLLFVPCRFLAVARLRRLIPLLLCVPVRMSRSDMTLLLPFSRMVRLILSDMISRSHDRSETGGHIPLPESESSSDATTPIGSHPCSIDFRVGPDALRHRYPIQCTRASHHRRQRQVVLPSYVCTHGSSLLLLLFISHRNTANGPLFRYLVTSPEI